MFNSTFVASLRTDLFFTGWTVRTAIHLSVSTISNLLRRTYISPELVNELRIGQPCYPNFRAPASKPSWPGPEHAGSRIPLPLQSSQGRKAAGSFGIGPLSKVAV